MKALYSYDIFDTCLVRTCGEPKHVFDILATKILGKGSDISTKSDFVLIRMNAEREARKKLILEGNEEITLKDIYNFCDFSIITNLDNNKIMAMELEIEDQVLMPVERIRKEIEKLVEKGAQVVYISDMYLPLDFISRKLKEFGFHVNKNIYLSSDIRKAKNTGHLYDYVAKQTKTNINSWRHIGDNKYSDYIIPKKKGIKAILIKHAYNQYEALGKSYTKNGFWPNAGYAFSLSKAIRLSLPNSPNNSFASTFVAPMFVSYVYQILCDSRKRGIKHLFFLARDGYILYYIALEFAKYFPDISLSYLYVSRQALYMAGLNEINAKCVKDTMPYLKNEKIEKILYDLHLSSFNFSCLPIGELNGEQILDKLFENESFVQELKNKHKEQNDNIIKYFEHEGLTKGQCATVDVVGSRRCQNALNRILNRYNYPEAFAYYFEVTWSRITDKKPYLSMNYQENVIGTTLYNHASQALYEQFFAISDQNRTIEYQKRKDNSIMPIFEADYLSDNYKQKIFSINKSICTTYARHYIIGCDTNPISIIQAAQRAFTLFCYVPQKEYLLAIESFRCTGSGEANEILLVKKSLIYTITHIKQFFRWPEGQLIYSSGVFYPIVLFLLKFRYNRKRKLSMH